MIEEFEYNGIWWLPEKPEAQISGTLKFSPNEGAILNLIGSFKEIININKMLAPDIILGVSSTGKNITLYKCFETKSSFSMPGFQTSSFSANIVFIGAHFKNSKDIKFKSIATHFFLLDEWVNISGFDIKYLWKEKGVIIKYKLLKPFQVNINDNLKLLIDIRATFPSLSVVQKEASIKQKTWIEIESLEELHFEDYLKILYHIRNFLTLGVSESVYPLAIEGITDQNKQIINNNVYNQPIEIFYMLPDMLKTPEMLHPFDMLFTFKDISNKFEFFLRNWFQKADLLAPVYDLYFGTLFNPHIYLEHKFLSLIQAIESFQQRVYGGKYLLDEEYSHIYNILVNAIPAGTNEEFKESLKSKLKYGNEFTLRKRLKNIFDKYHEILNIFIDNNRSFIEKVIATRNYETHHDASLKEYSAHGEELYHLNQILKILLEICLLSELGFSSMEIKNLFSRNRRYRHAYIR